MSSKRVDYLRSQHWVVFFSTHSNEGSQWLKLMTQRLKKVFGC